MSTNSPSGTLLVLTAPPSGHLRTPATGFSLGMLRRAVATMSPRPAKPQTRGFALADSTTFSNVAGSARTIAGSEGSRGRTL